MPVFTSQQKMFKLTYCTCTLLKFVTGQVLTLIHGTQEVSLFQFSLSSLAKTILYYKYLYHGQLVEVMSKYLIALHASLNL